MGMSFRPGRIQVGPFRINLSTRAAKEGRLPVSSVSLGTGPITTRLWDGKNRPGVSSIDTPGMGSIRITPSRRQPQRAAAPLEHTPESGAPLEHTPSNRQSNP